MKPLFKCFDISSSSFPSQQENPFQSAASVWPIDEVEKREESENVKKCQKHDRQRQAKNAEHTKCESNWIHWVLMSFFVPISVIRQTLNDIDEEWQIRRSKNSFRLPFLSVVLLSSKRETQLIVLTVKNQRNWHVYRRLNHCFTPDFNRNPFKQMKCFISRSLVNRFISNFNFLPSSSRSHCLHYLLSHFALCIYVLVFSSFGFNQISSNCFKRNPNNDRDIKRRRKRKK